MIVKTDGSFEALLLIPNDDTADVDHFSPRQTSTTRTAASGATAPGPRSSGTRGRRSPRALWRTAPEVGPYNDDDDDDARAAGQCRDDSDCTPWAPSCSPLGYCRGGVQVGLQCRNQALGLSLF